MAAHIKQVAGVANLSSASGAQQPEQPSPLPKHAVFASATVTFASHALVLDSNATMRDICASALRVSSDSEAIVISVAGGLVGVVGAVGMAYGGSVSS